MRDIGQGGQRLAINLKPPENPQPRHTALKSYVDTAFHIGIIPSMAGDSTPRSSSPTNRGEQRRVSANWTCTVPAAQAVLASLDASRKSKRITPPKKTRQHWTLRKPKTWPHQTRVFLEPAFFQGETSRCPHAPNPDLYAQRKAQIIAIEHMRKRNGTRNPNLSGRKRSKQKSPRLNQHRPRQHSHRLQAVRTQHLP